MENGIWEASLEGLEALQHTDNEVLGMDIFNRPMKQRWGEGHELISGSDSPPRL